MLAVAIGAGEAIYAYLIAVPVIFMVNTIPVIGSRLGTEQGLFVLFLGLAGVDAGSRPGGRRAQARAGPRPRPCPARTGCSRGGVAQSIRPAERLCYWSCM
jgi:hypothetical protein